MRKGGQIVLTENHETKNKSLAEIILDPDCDAPVILHDARGAEHAFDRVATLTLDGRLYAMLTPRPEERIARGGVFAFEYDPEIDELQCVVDETLYERVYDAYLSLFRRQQ